MCSVKGDRGGFLELVLTDSIQENSSKSYEFTCNARSGGFTVSLKGIWFYRDDLERFSNELKKVAEEKSLRQVVLQAISDYILNVTAIGVSGQFKFECHLIDRLILNRATIVVQVYTQELLDFSDQIDFLTRG